MELQANASGLRISLQPSHLLEKEYASGSGMQALTKNIKSLEP